MPRFTGPALAKVDFGRQWRARPNPSGKMPACTRHHHAGLAPKPQHFAIRVRF